MSNVKAEAVAVVKPSEKVKLLSMAFIANINVSQRPGVSDRE